jgi:hypothetical protein
VIIYTLWIMRRGEPEPELMEAWDEFSFDANPDGFKRACQEALLSVASDVTDYRYIDLNVNAAELTRQFGRPKLDVTVVGTQ